MAVDWPSLTRSPEDLALAAQIACLLEVSAPKPGNVTRQADFTDTRLEDFLLSAAAIGPAFGRAALDAVGQIVWNAVSSTRRVVSSNTNLGMVLLLAPLARACAQPGDMHANLRTELHALTVEDARQAYAAIRLAGAGGMGKAAQADVAGEPEITLGEAMALAREWDSIAKEYATGFAITFDITWPALRGASGATSQPADAIVLTYLKVLAQVPDTLISRKRGTEAAEWVSRQAQLVLDRGSIFTDAGRLALAEFDGALRDEHHTLNPGTTADLVAAALFLHLVSGP